MQDYTDDIRPFYEDSFARLCAYNYGIYRWRDSVRANEFVDFMASLDAYDQQMIARIRGFGRAGDEFEESLTA